MSRRDVSKDVVVVLLVLTVIVSILGTWQVTVAASKIKAPTFEETPQQSSTGLVINIPTSDIGSTSGKVSLYITGEENAGDI